MKGIIGRIGALVIAIGTWAGCPGRVEAGLVTYTESDVVTGALGQQGFTSLMTVTLTADTASITQVGAYHDTGRVLTATVTVDGLTATFLDPIYVFSGDNFAGFTDVSPLTMVGTTILEVYNPSFTNDDLATAQGPLGGLAGGGGGGFSTTLGTLSVQIYSGNGSFTATPSAVPEPSSLALCGIAGAAGLAYARRPGLRSRRRPRLRRPRSSRSRRWPATTA